MEVFESQMSFIAAPSSCEEKEEDHLPFLNSSLDSLSSVSTSSSTALPLVIAITEVSEGGRQSRSHRWSSAASLPSGLPLLPRGDGPAHSSEEKEREEEAPSKARKPSHDSNTSTATSHLPDPESSIVPSSPSSDPSDSSDDDDAPHPALLDALHQTHVDLWRLEAIDATDASVHPTPLPAFSASSPALLASTASPTHTSNPSTRLPTRLSSASKAPPASNPATASSTLSSSPSVTSRTSLLTRLFRGRGLGPRRSSADCPPPPSAPTPERRRVDADSPSLANRSPSYSSQCNPLCTPPSPTAADPSRHPRSDRWRHTAPLPLIPLTEAHIEADDAPDAADDEPDRVDDPADDADDASQVSDVAPLSPGHRALGTQTPTSQAAYHQLRLGGGPVSPRGAPHLRQLSSSSPLASSSSVSSSTPTTSSPRHAPSAPALPPPMAEASTTWLGESAPVASFALRSFCSLPALMHGVLLKRAETRSSFISHLFVLTSPTVLLYFDYPHSARPIGGLALEKGSLRVEGGWAFTPQHMHSQSLHQPPPHPPSQLPPAPQLTSTSSVPSPASQSVSSMSESSSPSSPSSSLSATVSMPAVGKGERGSAVLAGGGGGVGVSVLPVSPAVTSGRMSFSVVADGVSWKHNRVYSGRRYHFQVSQSEQFDNWIFVLRAHVLTQRTQ